MPCRDDLPCDSNRRQRPQRLISSFTRLLLLSFGISLSGTSIASDGLSWPVLPEVVGSSAGEFRVNESGSAIYTIPVNLPKGIAGLTPQLALTYDSQGGNGHLGKGWSLEGLSAISRCRPSLEIEGHVDAEPTRFCLDGQKLIVSDGQTYGAEGAEYRTEIDAFSKVISYGSQNGYPTHFKVWRKDGSVTEYGNTEDSRIEGQGSQVPVAWSINKIQDNLQLENNSILFSYLEDNTNGEFALDQIAYAGGQWIAKLHYFDQRPDQQSFYSAGYKSSITKRLEAIEVSKNSQLNRRFILSYQKDAVTGQSQLASMQECSSTACQSATEFDWQTLLTNFEPAKTVNLANNFSYAKVADLNGDGVNDLVAAIVQSGRTSLFSYISNNNTLEPINNEINLGSIGKNDWQLLDHNSDGYADLFYKAGNTWKIRLGSAEGIDASIIQTGVYSNNNYYPRDAYLLDITGEGLQDVVYLDTYGEIRSYSSFPSSPYVQTTVKNTSSNEPYILSPETLAESLFILPKYPHGACSSSLPYYCKSILTRILPNQYSDINGDGVIDPVGLVTMRRSQGGVNSSPWTDLKQAWYLLLSDRSSGKFKYSGTPISNPEQLVFIDLNSDSLPDKIYRDQFYLNTGDGFGVAQTLGINLSSETIRKSLDFNDYNGDGINDIHYISGSKHWVKLWNGSGYDDPIETNLEYKSADNNYFLDLNGDGHRDYVHIASNGTATIQLAKAGGAARSKIVSITSGLGAKTNITYAPLTESGLYTKGTGAAWLRWGTCLNGNCSPVFDIGGPFYVVKSVSSSAPVGSGTTIDPLTESRVDYQYAEARMQSGGRGFLGYGKLITTDAQTGVVTETTYRQDFPYTGMPSSTVVKTAGGTLLSESTNTWDIKQNGKVYQPWLKSSLEKGYDLATGALLKTITTTQTTDDFGNVLEMAVTTEGGGTSNTKTTVSQYTNDVAKWHLGRLTRSTVTTTQASDTETRTSAFEYDAVTGMLTKEIVEPDDARFRTATAYTYDAWGNQLTSTLSGEGIPTRSSSNTFSADGLYLVSKTNALGQVTEQILERDTFGRPLRIADINGVETTFAYDGMGRKSGERHASGAGKDYALFTCADAPVSCPPSGALVVEVKALGGAPAWEIQDILGRTIRKVTTGFDGKKVYTDSLYDNLSRPLKVSEPYFEGDPVYWHSTEYDILGRTVKVTNANGDSETVSYSGYTTVKTNAKGHRVTELHNALGQLVQVTDNLNNTIDYRYDLQGNLVNTVQTASDSGASARTSITYDRMGRKVAMDDEDKGQWQYTYNVLGQLVQQTDAKGQTVEFTYDLLGRKLTRIDRRGDRTIEGNTTWTYDQGTKGVLSEVSDSISGFGQVYSYDAYGRPTGAGTTFEGEMYLQTTAYDSVGRVSEKNDAAGASSGIRYLYNSHGYMEAIQDMASEREWYRVNSLDARGNAVVQTIGGMQQTKYYAPRTGFLERQTIGAAGIFVQDLSYQWDIVGNLEQRTDNSTSTALVETFGYDGLNRLTHSAVGERTDRYAYDGLGNITSKTGVGTYTYGQNGAGIHAVTHTSIGDISYQYDANGNMISGDGRTLEYSTFDKPVRIQKNGHTTEFQYDINRSRFKRVDTDKNSDTTVTRYLGNVEFITRPSGNREVKRYINGVVIDTTTTRVDSTTISSVQLLFKDHLGSVHTIMDGNSMTVLQRQSFDPFGLRRDPTNWQALLEEQLSLFNTQYTTRGFTGHEQLDEVGLIHMNGRVYYAKLGRFLQADPFIQAVGNTQNFNRYSYLNNNPLNAVDPSGFFLKKLFKGLKKFIKKYWKVVVAIAVTYVTAGAASGWATSWGFAANTAGNAMVAGAVAGAAGGFTAGLLMTGNLKGAIKGAFTGAIAGTAGGYANFGKVGGWADVAKRVGVSALGGCASGKVSGGSCEKGAKLAAMAQSLSVGIEKFTQSKPTYKTPENKSGTYKPSESAIVDKKYCVTCDVVDSKSNNIGIGVRTTKENSHLNGHSTQDAGWMSITEGSKGSQLLANIPGMNSGAVFHDILVGTVERGLNIHTLSTTTKNLAGLFTNQMTIVPAIGLNYVALGANSYDYYTDQLAQGAN
ncbi:RHS repeat-associated core domain-containing protein [Endozoicomonas acroporae]|uniref:RHS repeat-associated core domain-containing protein n=1 Tax=Endozoicomonas acroporae TaxID=1701104 RepID=UPI0013D3D642|nr:RHS repeat-associated core domain-containing protein [Endozoicomonas acroporae]